MIRITWCVGMVFFLCCELVHSEESAITASLANHAARGIAFKAHDGVAMFGRLVLPKSDAPRAIVVYVQTAEGQTVDIKRSLGNGRTFNYYDIYRKKLPPMGVGFFSYEGRGIRLGAGPPRYEQIEWEVYNTSTLENKVRDVLSAIEALRRQDGLQCTPILLMGASEGTLLASEAAARKPDSVAGLVLYGVAANNLKEILTYIMSDGEFLRFRPVDENRDGIVTQKEWDNIAKNPDFSKYDLNADGQITVADIKLSTKKLLDAIETNDYEVLQAWAKAAAGLSVPEGWFEDHFNHADIWTFLSKLDMPVGCFHGDADRMAPVAAVKGLEAKAEEAGSTNMEFHYFEGLDHSLNVGQYFVNGQLPKGHQAIFEFIDRIATEHAQDNLGESR